MENKNIKEENGMVGELNNDQVLYDVDYIQASTLKELKTKVRKKLEEDFVVETNPFFDESTKMWTQMMLLYMYEDEIEEYEKG